MNLNELPEPDEGEQELVRRALFEGDSGRLALETRRVLVQLLQGPFIDERRHSILWRSLLRDEELVRERLGDIFLELVIDSELKVAFTRQAEPAGLEIPRLLRTMSLSFIDSVLLLHLRRLLADSAARGERAVVEPAELLDHMAIYERSGDTDHALFAKRASSAVEKLKKNALLSKLPGTEERYEVSPALAILFPAEEIAALARRYEAIKAGASLGDSDDGGDQSGDAGAGADGREDEE
ncbi:MAG: DUF4194 domain-containing protein [Spirochaetota bacterium]